MIFTETKLAGAFVIDLEPREDERGFFARSFCQREFEERGLRPTIAQSGLARNWKKGTLRGLHFQFPPAAETKLVRCIRGAILDVIVDLRPESQTYLEHFAVELDAQSMRALYLPERFAHGYQSLCHNTLTSYELGAFYTPGLEGGLRYDDPMLGIEWPLPVTVISAKDRNHRPLDEIGDQLRRRMLAANYPLGAGFAERTDLWQANCQITSNLNTHTPAELRQLHRSRRSVQLRPKHSGAQKEPLT